MNEDQALTHLQAILARPEYQVDRSVPWWQQLLAPILGIAWRLLAQFVQLVLDSTSGRQGSLGIVAVLASAAVLIAAGAYVLRAVRLSVVGETRLRGASLAECRQRSDELWRQAQQLATLGKLDEGLQMAYLSALYALDERALLRVEINLTNREHAQRLARQHPALGEPFNDLVERYERVRYGGASVAAETFTDFSARAQHVRSAALEGSSA
jgi:hypothetical protein